MFTKNLTNPAYGEARLGAERAATELDVQVLHFVLQKGDDADEQKELIEQALAIEPCLDAFVLSPMHLTKVNPAIPKITPRAAQKRNEIETAKWGAVISTANIKRN